MNNITVTNTTLLLNNTSSLHKQPAWITLLPNILVIVIGLLGIILNGILLVVVFRNASIIFKFNGAYLVTNVAVADLLTGIFSLFYGIVEYLQIQLSETQEQVIHAFFWTSVEASLITVFVMSLIRYITIVYPLSSQNWLSKKVPTYSCVLVWSISLCCGILMALYHSIVRFSLSVLFEITTLSSAFLYYKIFTILAQRRHLVPLPANNCSAPASTRGPSSRLLKDLKREYELTSVVVMITIIMVVTVLPHMIGGQIYISYVLFSSATPPQGLLLFVTYYLPVELSNFVLNPIVYAWRLPKYRHALRRTFKPLLHVLQCNSALTAGQSVENGSEFQHLNSNRTTRS